MGTPFKWAASWENLLFFKCENKDEDRFCAFVFAPGMLQSLYFLNPKFQASSHLLWLYSPLCVGPGRKPRRPVFSRRSSNHIIALRERLRTTRTLPWCICNRAVQTVSTIFYCALRLYNSFFNTQLSWASLLIIIVKTATNLRYFYVQCSAQVSMKRKKAFIT